MFVVNILIILGFIWGKSNVLASDVDSISEKIEVSPEEEFRGPEKDKLDGDLLQHVDMENNYSSYYGSSWYEGSIQDDDIPYEYYGSWASGSYSYAYDDQQWYYSGDEYFYYDDGMQLTGISDKSINLDDTKIQQKNLRTKDNKPVPNNKRMKRKAKPQVAEDNASNLRGSRLQDLLTETDFEILGTFEKHVSNDILPSCCTIPSDQCNVNGVVCPLVNELNVDPVCGCDGVTYSNACFAENFGCIQAWKPGACPN